jgi:hypothetical protein
MRKSTQAAERFFVKEEVMKTLKSVLIFAALLLSAGCAYNGAYQIPMAPQPIRLAVDKPIPLEAALLISQETRERIFKSPSLSNIGGEIIYYTLEPYQLPLGQAFEQLSLHLFSQVFQKVRLIRRPEEAGNALPYGRVGAYRGYTEFADVQSQAKITCNLTTKGRPIWQKTVETPVQKGRLISSGLLEEDVGKFASDTLVLALRQMIDEMWQERGAPKGWLDEALPSAR